MWRVWCPGDGFGDGDGNGIRSNVADASLYAARARLDSHHRTSRGVQREPQLTRVDVDDGPEDVRVHHGITSRAYCLHFEQERVTDRHGEGFGIDLQRNYPVEVRADRRARRDSRRDNSGSSERLQCSLACPK